MSRVSTALLAALILAAPSPAFAQATGLSVRTDPRVELLAIVFHLAGNPEYNMGRVPPYVRAIDEYFAPYREHAAVQAAKHLRAQRGVSFDAVMSLAIHIDDASSPQPRRPFTDPDSSLEHRWNAAAANAFIEQLASFAHDSRFDEFLAANQAVLDTARSRMDRVVRANLDIAALTAFFGREPNGAFIMVPLVANGAGNFGVRYLVGDREEDYAIIGTSADSTGWPAFDARFVPTMVHEFSHSFVNPAVAPVEEQFRAAGEAIFPKVEQDMRSQAYGSWLTMLNESLVRVSVARYVRAQRGDSAARREVTAQRARGFLWTDELYELFGEYERDRGRYPTLDAFLPRVAEYFTGLAPRVAGMIAQFDSVRPRLASASPAAQAAGVDAALDRIVLRFDRPMAPGYMINLGVSGREHFPDVSRVEWDDTGTTLTMFVKLKAAWSYELVLGPGFTSRADGAPLSNTPVRFSTR